MFPLFNLYFSNIYYFAAILSLFMAEHKKEYGKFKFIFLLYINNLESLNKQVYL